MKFTDEEKAILDGRQGSCRQKALELLVTVGEIYGAERLIDVQSVHMPGASIMGIGEAGLRFVEGMGADNTQTAVYATTNPASMPPEGNIAVGLQSKEIDDQIRLTQTYERMGVYVCNSCTPYLIGNAPRPGEHVSWGESSAVGYANSVLGARTNREGGPTSLASAITGKTPLYGYHLDRNRTGQVLIKVDKKPDGVTEYGTLGYYVGKQVEKSVPVFEGIPPDVSADELKMLAAGLASSGAVALFHIIGVTGEAATAEQAFQGRKAARVVAYGNPQEQETVALLNKATGNAVEWVTLGCPHFSITEFRELALLLEGKRIHPDVILWVNTSVPVAAYAEKLGYAQAIEAAGAQIVCETCPSHTPSGVFAQERGISTLTTNSSKMAHYVPGQFGILTRYGNTRQCIQAAVTGKWR